MHQSAISTITELERELDTGGISYGGVNAWPLCRLKLWVHLMAEGFKEIAGPDAATMPNTGPTFQDVGKLNAHAIGDLDLGLVHCDLEASKKAWNVSTASPDLMFFLRPEEHREMVDGKAYAKILDSLFDRFPNHSRVKIEWAEPTAMAFPRKNPSFFLHGDAAARSAISDPPFKLEHFDELEHALAQKGMSHVISRDQIATEMGKVLRFSRLFEVTLTRMMPKAIFLSLYCHSLGMGLVLAARRLGIPTVDLQHGRLGPHHGLYTQLTAAPENGYDIVPDRIWCWGQQTKDDIDKDLNPRCSKHSGLVGGNPWLDQWRNGATDLTNQANAKNLIARTTKHKKIIVSLQPIPQPLPQFVLDAMADAPDNWSWWIRVHPLRRHTIPELSALLAEHGIVNYEIEDTTSLPLFWLLRHAHHHVTSFSSVTIEALAFGIRTTVFSDVGRNTFENYIKNGHALYADSAETLIDSINESLCMKEPCEKSPFINADSSIAEQAMDTILNGPN